jgi:hypothetical protein
MPVQALVTEDIVCIVVFSVGEPTILKESTFRVGGYEHQNTESDVNIVNI